MLIFLVYGTYMGRACVGVFIRSGLRVSVPNNSSREPGL